MEVSGLSAGFRNVQRSGGPPFVEGERPESDAGLDEARIDSNRAEEPGFRIAPASELEVAIPQLIAVCGPGSCRRSAPCHHEPKAPTAKVRPKSECAFCHQASAKKDEVWTQFYRLLDD